MLGDREACKHVARPQPTDVTHETSPPGGVCHSSLTILGRPLSTARDNRTEHAGRADRFQSRPDQPQDLVEAVVGIVIVPIEERLQRGRRQVANPGAVLRRRRGRRNPAVHAVQLAAHETGIDLQVRDSGLDAIDVGRRGLGAACFKLALRRPKGVAFRLDEVVEEKAS